MIIIMATPALFLMVFLPSAVAYEQPAAPGAARAEPVVVGFPAGAEPAPGGAGATAASGSQPGTRPATAPAPAAVRIGVFDHGKTFPAQVGQQIVVELPATSDNPWSLETIDGSAIQQVGQIEFKPRREGEKDGLYTATFKAVKEGQAKVRLQANIQPGKKDKMAIEFTVKVSAPKTD